MYIAAFAPDRGESVASLIKDPPPGAPVPPILPPQNGYLPHDRAKLAATFAADVAADRAAFMANSPVPWGVEALERCGPLAGMEDQAELVSGGDGGPDDPTAGPACHAGRLRRDRRWSRSPGSHVIYVSRPAAVAALITAAATGVNVKTIRVL